jgi:acetylornithine/N-succinyldiaminopimelate aminotransferase
MPTYARLPVSFTRGEGAWLWDLNGKRYLDALSGIAVCNLGHSHPAVHQAICSQSKTLLHTSNLYRIDSQEQLASELARLSGMDKAFFCNSGAEANEAAIKLARLYGHKKNIHRPAILVMEKSFHGRTLATLSATGNPKIQQGFAPLVDGFIHVPYNDVAAVKKAITEHDNIVAILVEPIQGEGGVIIPATDYLNHLRDICDQHQLLLMLDEVQAGMGRTGKMFAFQHNNILPDVCTLAKALGNGVPIGACLARGNAAKTLSAGTHGSTFGGNPLACSAALAVLKILQDENLPAQAERQGQQICAALTSRLHNNDQIVDIRHKGLMIGIELSQPCTELVAKALAEGLLINVTGENTIRLLPPLIIDNEQTNLLVETLTTLIQEHSQ